MRFALHSDGEMESGRATASGHGATASGYSDEAAEAAEVRVGWAAKARAAAKGATAAEAASGSVFISCKQGANRSGTAMTAAFLMAQYADDLELTTDSEGEHVPRHPRRARGMASGRATASGHGATASGDSKK